MGASNNYRQRLEAAAQLLGIVIAEKQLDALLSYLDQLQRWNRTYNLTAVRDAEQMLIQHVFDSLTILPNILEILDKNTVKNITVVDVGSGAGLHGVVLAIGRASCRERVCQYV